MTQEKNIVVVPATIIESKGVQSFAGEDGKAIKFASILVRASGVVLKFKVKVDTDLLDRIGQAVDEEIKLECELYSGAGLSAQLRVIGVQE